jgi:hypothetical protein
VQAKILQVLYEQPQDTGDPEKIVVVVIVNCRSNSQVVVRKGMVFPVLSLCPRSARNFYPHMPVSTWNRLREN